MMILKALDKRISNTVGAFGTASAAISAWAYAERNGARVIHNRWAAARWLFLSAKHARGKESRLSCSSGLQRVQLSIVQSTL
jgi:hypothetical protein